MGNSLVEFPEDSSDGKESPCDLQETWVPSLGWDYSLEKETATHSSILAWKIPWSVWSLAGYSPWGRKELDRTEQLHLLTTSYSYFVFVHVCVCVYGKHTFEIYSVSEFQVYSTVWLTIITMLIRSQELILCINESLYSLTNFSLFPPTRSPKQPLLHTLVS